LGLVLDLRSPEFQARMPSPASPALAPTEPAETVSEDLRACRASYVAGACH